jgi:hypothetical protein
VKGCGGDGGASETKRRTRTLRRQSEAPELSSGNWKGCCHGRPFNFVGLGAFSLCTSNSNNKRGRFIASFKDGGGGLAALTCSIGDPLSAAQRANATPAAARRQDAMGDAAALAVAQQRAAQAEERLAELKALVDDLRRDRDAWREQAQARVLPAPGAKISWWRWLRSTG